MDNFRSEYQRLGYQHLKGVFDPVQVGELLSQTKWVFLQQMHRAGIRTEFDEEDEVAFGAAMAELFKLDIDAFINCGKQVQHSFALHRMALDERLEVLLRDLGLTHPNICTRPVLYFNHPSLARKRVYHTVFPHQDWRSMQGSLDAVVIWCPLLDINRSLGALEVVPGSHRRGLLTGSVEDGFGKVDEALLDADSFQSVEVQQGDALFFSSLLVHRSGDNITDRIRWSCHFRYNNLTDPTFIERKYHHNYLYRPNDELQPESRPKQADIDALFGPHH
jgi:phytanoyl-CoA hydroxylase